VFTGRATRGLYGPTDRATCGLWAEEAAHGPPGHRTGPPVARKVQIGPAQVPGCFYGPWARPRIAGHMANYSYLVGKKTRTGTGMGKNLNPHAGMSFLAGGS
jgi:hypothetical protein